MATAGSYSALVQELYVAYFGRPADYYGLQNFEAALAAANAPTDPAALALAYSTNAAVKSLVDSFGTSAESTALYGSGSTESFVNAIFENLFGRPAAVSGLTFWVNAIESGAVSQGDAALAILAGSEPTSNSSSQATADWALVQAKVSVATNFTTALGASSTQIVDYSGATAAQDARLMLSGVTAANAPTFDVQTTINDIVAGNTQNTFNLTTGVDTILGGTGNNTFNAILDNTAGLAAGGQAATLQAFDTITGGTLNNTLNITDFGIGGQTSIPSGATITGITALNINTLQGVTGDFSTWTGLTVLDIKSADGAVSLTVPDATAVNVNDTAGTISISGGSTVTAKTDTTNEIIVQGGADTSSVSLTGGVYNDITDLNYGTGKANSITTVSLTANGVTGQYSYTTIDSDALTTLNVTSEATGVYVDAAAGTRTLTVNVDGDGPGYVSSTGAWIKDDTATTLVVNAINNASDVYFQANSATSVTFNDSVDLTVSKLYLADAKTITITGAGDFSADFTTPSGFYATAAINATGASGVVTATLAPGQSFTGGSGQDVVSIGAAQTGTVTGGSAADNEIVLNNAGTATVADIAAVTHFSIFGIDGNTQGVFDMSKVSGYDAFDVQGAGGNVTFTNAVAGSSLSIEAGDISGDIITLQTADANGASDSTTVNIGSATDVPFGITVGQITLEDANFVGTANVTINNVVGSSEVHNTISTLNDNNIVSLNLTGSGELTIETMNIDSTSLTISNGIAGHSSISAGIESLTDNHLTTLTIGGANGFGIGTLASTSASLTVVDNNSAAVEISNFNDTSLTTATFTNSVNTTAATFHVGSGAITEASLATLNLNGNVQISIAGDTVTSGITVAGSSDNATVDLTFTGQTAAAKTNAIALGNGNDTIVLGSSSVAAVPGATEVDTVTWKPITGNAGATETVDVVWQDFATAAVGSETIGGMTISSDGSLTFTAAQVAAVAEGGTIAGLTITTAPTAWTPSAGTGSNDTTFTSTTTNAAVSDPSDASFTGSGAAPTFTETVVGVAPAGGSESIGGATVTGTAGAYTAAQVATVAAGGSVIGLALSTSPTLWNVGAASGATTTFTSTTPNHAEAGPTGAGASGDATDPTSVQTTAGVTPVSGSGGGGVATSTDTLTLGTGNDAVTDYTLGTLNVSITESGTSTDSITANTASTLHATVGNGANTISDTAAGASISITVGTGANSITVGANSSGTITLGTHTGTDAISIGASGASLTAIEKISGLNNATTDTLTFSGDANALTGFTQVTAGAVVGSGGDTTLLADWVAAADGKAGSGLTAAAHSVTWFQYQGNTYLLESVAGATADAGTMVAGNTLVELTGTGYTFAHTTGAAGVVHLLG